MKANENLKVKNFCGIKNADIELEKFLVLIGPQSSGKSIISKLIYWARLSVANVFFEVQDGATYRDVLKSAKEKFEELFVLDLTQDFEIDYQLGNVCISVARNQRKGVKLTFCKEFSAMIGEFVRHNRQRVTEDEGEVMRRASYVRREARKYFNFLVERTAKEPSGARWPVYAPAARSFFSQVEDSLFVFLASSKRLDPVVEGFGDYFGWAKDSLLRNYELKKDNAFLDKLYAEVLRGRYVRIQKQDYIEHPDGRTVPVSSASSGQQEFFPLCVILGQMEKQAGLPQLTIIEEPEAHLHPAAQRVIVEAIIHAATVGGGQVILTTHSPYVLSVLNNLYLAGVVWEEHREKYLAIQEKTPLIFGSVISKGKLSAYALVDGETTPLIDAETNLLRADAIDLVSQEISSEFDTLVNAIY